MSTGISWITGQAVLSDRGVYIPNTNLRAYTANRVLIAVLTSGRLAALSGGDANIGEVGVTIGPMEGRISIDDRR